MHHLTITAMLKSNTQDVKIQIWSFCKITLNLQNIQNDQEN